MHFNNTGQALDTTVGLDADNVVVACSSSDARFLWSEEGNQLPHNTSTAHPNRLKSLLHPVVDVVETEDTVTLFQKKFFFLK